MLQAYLGLLGVAYERELCASPLSTPSGALPCLAFDDELVIQPASASLLGDLGGLHGSLRRLAAVVADLDAPLAPHVRAEAAAFAALVEEHVAPATARSRAASRCSRGRMTPS